MLCLLSFHVERSPTLPLLWQHLQLETNLSPRKNAAEFYYRTPSLSTTQSYQSAANNLLVSVRLHATVAARHHSSLAPVHHGLHDYVRGLIWQLRVPTASPIRPPPYAHAYTCTRAYNLTWYVEGVNVGSKESCCRCRCCCYCWWCFWCFYWCFYFCCCNYFCCCFFFRCCCCCCYFSSAFRLNLQLVTLWRGIFFNWK